MNEKRAIQTIKALSDDPVNLAMSYDHPRSQ